MLRPLACVLMFAAFPAHAEPDPAADGADPIPVRLARLREAVANAPTACVGQSTGITPALADLARPDARTDDVADALVTLLETAPDPQLQFEAAWALHEAGFEFADALISYRARVWAEAKILWRNDPMDYRSHNWRDWSTLRETWPEAPESCIKMVELAWANDMPEQDPAAMFAGLLPAAPTDPRAWSLSEPQERLSLDAGSHAETRKQRDDLTGGIAATTDLEVAWWLRLAATRELGKATLCDAPALGALRRGFLESNEDIRFASVWAVGRMARKLRSGADPACPKEPGVSARLIEGVTAVFRSQDASAALRGEAARTIADLWLASGSPGGRPKLLAEAAATPDPVVATFDRFTGHDRF